KGLMALLTLALLALLWAGRWRRLPPRHTLSLIVLFALGLEYFLPQRWSYVDVMFLLPLALSAGLLRLPHFGPRLALGLVLLGLVLGHCLVLRDLIGLTSLLRSVLVMVPLTLLAAGLWLSRLRRPRQVFRPAPRN